jgi:hypothetical protein
MYQPSLKYPEFNNAIDVTNSLVFQFVICPSFFCYFLSYDM